MFDASAFAGPWPFGDGRHETLSGLAACLHAAGVEAAAVSPARAVLAPEPMAASRLLLDAVAGQRDEVRLIVPVPIVDPSLACWREHLAECVERSGGRMRAVKIVPNYHGYRPVDDAAHELAQELARRGLTLCVQMRMADERAHHPLMKVPGVDATDVVKLASSLPDLPILVCGAYMAELATFAPQPTIHAELSFVESGYLLRDAVTALGADRLLLGTHAPLHYPAAGVAKLSSDELDPADFHRISRGNFVRLFGDPITTVQGAST
jgi:predicted TIM-barrel fold metal-dependent hydrolase